MVSSPRVAVVTMLKLSDYGIKNKYAGQLQMLKVNEDASCHSAECYASIMIKR